MTAREVRTDLQDNLKLDLIGPCAGHACESELLPEFPTSWYLTGYLVPTGADDEVRLQDDGDDELDVIPSPGGLDDDSPVDRSASGKNYLPSSMGITALIPAGAESVTATIEWGDYLEELIREDVQKDGRKKKIYGYRRTSKQTTVEINIDAVTSSEQVSLPVPDPSAPTDTRAQLSLSCIARPLPELPDGSLALTVFLVNRRSTDKDHSYRTCAFQTELKLCCEQGFIGRPDLRGTSDAHLSEQDNRISDLHYRDVLEYAVGHGVSVDWVKTPEGGSVAEVMTTWLPSSEVERVVASQIEDVEFRMFTLAAIPSAEALVASLMPLVTRYREWLDEQQSLLEKLDTKKRKETAQEIINGARAAAARIEKGIQLLGTEPEAFDAFVKANLCMGEAADRRLKDVPREKLAWRPFQLAFVLLNLPGLIDPQNEQRKFVELLFFPTGGGKTEAYLGLASFQIFYRRLIFPGVRSGGLSVLMRYTLRLLTLDQLGRAAALICAMELERRKDEEKWGSWPFEIGMWVGASTAPNRLGHQGYNGPGQNDTAYIKVKRYRDNSNANPAPIPLESCPWCETKYEKGSFRMVPNERKPKNLQITCRNYECDFHAAPGLPILTVDETIYRRLPCFIVATVDKFAALPWEGRAGALFGRVNRADSEGFYGPTDPLSKGTRMDDILPGPDLVIQDELHLISGPLGTVAGVYEAAIEKLCERYASDGQKVRLPKIIASTATVRRASHQIQALFGRETTEIFPPPGVNSTDSFFANTVSITPGEASTNGRLYLGIAAQGRSLKRVFLRAMLSIMSRSQALYQLGGEAAKEAADAYMTSICYFNSLRELGGSRRIVEDEVLMQLDRYSKRQRVEPSDPIFVDREIDMESIKELTSRVSTNDISRTKENMGFQHHEGSGCDVVLATNMISVGLDVPRLGLMVVLGQPKGSSEYIQATSRVGREPKRPGLVITLLNPHKPRDRSHFEKFRSFHESFYRSVEATSVTPFSPRALDRALAATLVGLVRHWLPEMTSPLGATEIRNSQLNDRFEKLCIYMAKRARSHRLDLDPEDREEVYHEVLQRSRKLMDDWRAIANRYVEEENYQVKYQKYEDGANAQPLLHGFLDPELAVLPKQFKDFRANRSMRDVESTTELIVERLVDPIAENQR